MAQLKITIKENRSDKQTKYYNKVNPENFKELSIILDDLKNLGYPVIKAMKETVRKDSDWDAAIGI